MRALSVVGAMVIATSFSTIVGLVLDAPYDWRNGLREFVWWAVFSTTLHFTGIINISFPERR